MDSAFIVFHGINDELQLPYSSTFSHSLKIPAVKKFASPRMTEYCGGAPFTGYSGSSAAFVPFWLSAFFFLIVLLNTIMISQFRVLFFSG